MIQSVFLIIALAMIYFVVGRLGLVLDNPSGYVSPIWPAAGFALAGLLFFGYRVAPGVLIGSFMTNLPVDAGVFSFSSQIESFGIPVSIAVGSTLQALVGAFLVNRYVDLDSGLIKAKDIFLFYIFAGSLSCLISPLWGVNTLFLSGVIGNSEYFFSLLTWWVGDTIGVLLLVPLLFILFAKPKAIWKQRQISMGIPMTLLFILVVLLFTINSEHDNRRLKSEFVQQTSLIGGSLEKSMAANLEVMYSVHNFLQSAKNIHADDFRLFLNDTLQRHPSIHAISWNQVVTLAQRDQFERYMKTQGYADFMIKEKNNGSVLMAKEREKYVVVTYIEPYAGNKKAVGYDVYSSDSRRRALDLAGSSGKLAATDPITLVQETDRQSGILFFLPLYENIISAQDVSDIKEQPTGYVVGVYRAGDLILETLKDFSLNNIVVSLRDETDQNNILPIATYAYDSEGRLQEYPTSVDIPNALKTSKTLLIAQKKWSLDIYATPDYIVEHRSIFAWVILLLSLLFATLLEFFLLLLTGRAILFSDVAKELSSEVERSKVLENDLIMANENLENRVKERTKDLHIAIKDALESKAVAETANKSKSSFLANMSHEIRTPMNAILGFVDQLSKTETDTNRQQYLNIIKNSGKTLLNIINDILDFSKIESGKMNLDKHPYKLSSFLDETMMLLQEKFEEKQIDFRYKLSSGLPECIYADAIRLQQVLLNLLGNALKFTPEKGTVNFDVNYDDDKKVICFGVSDTGIGIAKANQEKIFNAFDQEDGSITRKFGGTGLGLSISSRLVSMMDGELKVESEPGIGSKFYFDIPYEACEKETVEDESDSTLHSSKTAPVLSGHVLIVEDNKTNQMLLGMILDDLGITFDTANDGVEAVSMYHAQYNAILMDENMPNMDGIEATQRIREIEANKNFPHIPIIAVTANALSEDRQRFLDAGMDEYISKPYTEEDIISALKKVLQPKI